MTKVIVERTIYGAFFNLCTHSIAAEQGEASTWLGGPCSRRTANDEAEGHSATLMGNSEKGEPEDSMRSIILLLHCLQWRVSSRIPHPDRTLQVNVSQELVY